MSEDPGLAEYFAFNQDELTKITFADYSDNHLEQPAKHWFVMFRLVLPTLMSFHELP